MEEGTANCVIFYYSSDKYEAIDGISNCPLLWKCEFMSSFHGSLVHFMMAYLSQ